MLPSPSRAPSAPPDMTQHWGRRRKLIGEQTLSDCELRRDGVGSSLRPRTLPAAKLVESRSNSTTSITIASYRQTHVQVNRLVKLCLLGLMLILTITAQPTMASQSDQTNKPMIVSHEDHVIFRSQICNSPTLAVLQGLLADGKIQNTNGFDKSESKRNSDYQQDDPGSDPLLDSVGNEEMFADEDKDNKSVEEEEEGTEEDTKTLSSRGLAHKEQKKSGRGDVGVENDEDVGDVLSSPEYRYMRRRRRSIDVPEPSGQEAFWAQRETTELNDFTKDDNIDRLANEPKKVGKKSGQLYLRLFETDKKNKTMRKQLKQKIRQSPDFRNGSTPWDCQYFRYNTIAANAFPSAYTDGYCKVKKCFFKLYTCVPIQIQVKLLIRDPKRCNPLPTLTNSTMYEERWEIESRTATVGCNCKYVKPHKLRKSGG